MSQPLLFSRGISLNPFLYRGKIPCNKPHAAQQAPPKDKRVNPYTKTAFELQNFS
jgi:hypothetical protein